MVTGFFTLDINLLKHAKCTSFNTEININAPELYNILHCDIKKKNIYDTVKQHETAKSDIKYIHVDKNSVSVHILWVSTSHILSLHLNER